VVDPPGKKDREGIKKRRRARSYHESVLILQKLLILLGAHTALDGLNAPGCYNRATKTIIRDYLGEALLQVVKLVLSVPPEVQATDSLIRRPTLRRSHAQM